jgi:hypothetical protein
VDGSQSVTFGARPAIPTHVLITTLQLAMANATRIGSSRYVGDPMDHYDDLNLGIGYDNL